MQDTFSTTKCTNEELLSLTRAWIAVASGHHAHVTLEQIKVLFWERVATEYATKSAHSKTATELQEQWKSMCPSMVVFVTLFGEKWKSSKLSKDDGTCPKKVFEWAINAFRASTNSDFEYVAVTWLLVTQKMWWRVLKPQLLQHFELMHEEENFTNQDEQDFSASPSLCGFTRSRSEDEEEKDRRVRQRLESEDFLSLTPEVSQQPLSELSSQGSTPVKQVAALAEMEETAEVAHVTERRLELEIMTRSEEGLSEEAKEYLHLQRQQILLKLKERTQPQ